MVNNNINEEIKILQQQLNEKLIERWGQTNEETKKSVSMSLVTAEYAERSIDLTIKIKELEQEKYELKKTLLEELSQGVHQTYQDLIAEKENEVKKLEKERNSDTKFILEQAKNKEKLEEKVKELNNHKKIVVEIIEDYYIPTLDEVSEWRGKGNQELDKWLQPVCTQESMENFTETIPNWHEELVKEIERGEKSDIIVNMIEQLIKRAERAEAGEECNLLAIKKQEKWEQSKQEDLEKEKAVLEKAGEELLEQLEKEYKKNESRREHIERLETKLDGERELLKNEREKNAKQKIVIEESENQRQRYLSVKPLPKLPSKFKIFKEKAKTKFQQLIKRKESQEQKFVANIEIKTTK